MQLVQLASRERPNRKARGEHSESSCSGRAAERTSPTHPAATGATLPASDRPRVHDAIAGRATLELDPRRAGGTNRGIENGRPYCCQSQFVAYGDCHGRIHTISQPSIRGRKTRVCVLLRKIHGLNINTIDTHQKITDDACSNTPNYTPTIEADPGS